MEKPASVKPIEANHEAMAVLRNAIASTEDWWMLIGNGP